MPLNYSEAVQRLLWLGHEGSSLKWDLNNVRAVLARLGNPERRFASVHIAGTNGKGSVAAMTESILRTAGYRTALYTSPHLERMNERIAVSGRPASDTEFATAFNAVAAAVEALLAENALPNHPSFFETMTAMAFWHFAQTGVEVAVLEVGMGGRLDATNVVTPEVAVITSIDFDHERYLGHSIEQIAAEKAGIIKAGVPVVNAAENPVARAVVSKRVAEVGTPMVDLEAEYSASDVRTRDFGLYSFVARSNDGFTLPLELSLRGEFQVRNALVATVVAHQLAPRGWKIDSAAIASGIARVDWPGRLELTRREPLVFLDGAHNPAGARQVARFWQEHLAGRRIHLVYGTVRDKAVGEMTELLFPLAASVTLTQAATPRAAGAESLRPVAQALNPIVRVEPEPAQALASAMGRAAAEDVVFVTGSLFLVGDCRRALREMAAAVVLGGQSR
ncbi:MAG TPA: folylpolyglutamate synthase/dihydrofolate synthase family protein [Candidatus Xenobia bacterium]|nr:folylpolyglutamate synthase/dihydrofolate synthase family protein [Candidatus Xenobia bacterium]